MRQNSFQLAFVTGASSGLGESLARRLAQARIPLILTGRNSERLDRLAHELKSLVAVEIITCDLGSQRKKLLEILKDRVPDLIINNAGFTLYGDALAFATDTQMEILDINASAPIELTLEAARVLQSQNKQGVILNVSSLAGELVFPTMASYAAAKACLTSFSKSFDAEMQPHGIRILVSLPGQIETEFAARASGGKQFPHLSWAMKKEYAAERIWTQIVRKKPVDRFNWFYAWAALASRLLPSVWIAKAIRRDPI